MNKLPSARSSPRIINGVIKWYENDTFTLDIEILLEDQDDVPVEIKESDTIIVRFFNRSNDLVKEFEFTNISNSVVSLVFDDEVTALFPAGVYHYDVIFMSDSRTTLAKSNQLIVEEE